MQDSDNYKWYALFVKTGQEERVKDRINFNLNSTIKTLVPKRKLRERRGGAWKTVVRKLFPGYVLLGGDIDGENYGVIQATPGILKLLKTGSQPARIEPWEMDMLNRLTCSGDTIEYSDGLIADGKIVITNGPLLNMEGKILSIDRRKGRVKVNISFMGEPRIVDLGISILQPA